MLACASFQAFGTWICVLVLSLRGIHMGSLALALYCMYTQLVLQPYRASCMRLYVRLWMDVTLYGIVPSSSFNSNNNNDFFV
jgi:hypothetical protein